MNKVTIDTKIRQQLNRRHEEKRIGIKVNLYRNYEVLELYNSVKNTPASMRDIECIMVADSYVMTHLGHGTTQVAELDMVKIIRELTLEVSNTLSAIKDENFNPYLLVDLPYLEESSPSGQLKKAIEVSKDYLSCGGEAIKVEVSSENDVELVDKLIKEGIPIIAHVGYAPQKSELRRYAITYDECKKLIHFIQQLVDIGILGVVLEMVSQDVHELINHIFGKEIQVFAIFSGNGLVSGQSINVWDSVFIKEGKKAFPNTATLDVKKDRDLYTKEGVISSHISNLIKDVQDLKYPKPLRYHLSSPQREELKCML